MATSEYRKAQPRPPGGAPCATRLDKPYLWWASEASHQSQLANVSARSAFRPGVRYRFGNWPSGYDGRRIRGESSGCWCAIAANPVRSRHVRDGHDRWCIDDEGLQLGVRESAAEDLLQHHN